MRKCSRTCILPVLAVFHLLKRFLLIAVVALAGCDKENPFVTLSSSSVADLDDDGKIVWKRYQSALKNEDIGEINDIFDTPLECTSYQYLITGDENELRAVVIRVTNHCARTIILPEMSIGLVGKNIFLSQDLLKSKKIHVIKSGEVWSKQFLFKSKESELSLIYNKLNLTRLDSDGVKFESYRVPISKRDPAGN